MTCPLCKEENLPAAKFCDRCGASLAPQSPSPASPGRSWLFGSAPDCDVVLPQNTVSSHHCRLSATQDGFRIEDVGSTNGTFVNGQRITASVRVSPADAITLGKNVPLPWPALAAGRRESALAASGREPAPGNGAKEKVIRIGRDADNDVVLDYPMVSGHHARILLSDTEATIEDLSSRNGVAIGGPDRKISRAALRPDDTVYLGSLPVPVSRLLQKVSQGDAPHVSLAFGGNSMTLGRDPQSSRVLDHPMVSWRHARLTRTGNGFLVEDLGSTNGTFVNGTRISGAVAVKPGDRIGLGSYTFIFTAAGTVEQRDYRGNLTVEARNVTVDAPRKRLLEGVSFTIYPSELVGLMGPSGAGKTTLITALNGYSRPSSGNVLINGLDLYQNYDQFRGHIGYVPQDDIMHADLTVGQALYYTARLRLPSDYRKKEIDARVKQVISLLELDGTEGVIIGSPDKKGISGGQRKRVNLAMELLSDPSVLFLDEPTSGLAAQDALMVMKVLRKLADQGKTIIITIHQPGREVFRKMDSLIIVSKDKHSSDPGKMAYFGPAYPDSIQFFNPAGTNGGEPGAELSPDDALTGLDKKKTADWIFAYNASRYKREYVDERAGKLPDRSAQPIAAKTKRQPGLSQWWILVQRNFAVKLKDKANTAILLALAPAIAIFLMSALGSKAAKEQVDAVCLSLDAVNHPEKCANFPFLMSSYTIFFIIISALFLGCWTALKEIVAERAIYRRERMVNLKIPSYVASKFTVLGGFLVFVQCPVLLGILYTGAHLQGGFMPMLGVTICTALVALGMGLVISATVRTPDTSTSIAILIMILMILMAGALVSAHDIGTISNFMASRWGFEALLLLDSGNRPSWFAGSGMTTMADRFFSGDSRIEPVWCVLILLVMLIALAAGTMAILKMKDKR